MNPQDLIGFSLSHHTAPVELRERLNLADEEAKALLLELKAEGVIREGLLLSTCNRTEFYALPADPSVSVEYLIELIARGKSLDRETLQRARELAVRYSYCDAISHLYRVVGGIDSQIIGDQQIFAQVKDAFRVAKEAGTGGSFFTKLAHSAFRVAKRIRTETSISSGAATISYAAVEFTRKVYDDLRERTALVIGAGETAELAARHLVERRVGSLIVANRTTEKADDVLRRVRDGEIHARDRSISLAEIATVLHTVDIVISSTAAPGYVISAKDVRRAVEQRHSPYPLILLDIAVPRDIDPAASEVSRVFLKDIDDLRTIVDQNLERRKAEIPKAEEIISFELAEFLARQSKLEIGPTIKELRDKFEAVRSEELERHRSKMSDREYAMMDEMSRKMMNRLLHTPTISLKEPRGSMDDMLSRLELLRELFALDSAGEDSHQPSNDEE